LKAKDSQPQRAQRAQSRDDGNGRSLDGCLAAARPHTQHLTFHGVIISQKFGGVKMILTYNLTGFAAYIWSCETPEWSDGMVGDKDQDFSSLNPQPFQLPTRQGRIEKRLKPFRPGSAQKHPAKAGC
jgi:hypothetical protein